MPRPTTEHAHAETGTIRRGAMLALPLAVVVALFGIPYAVIATSLPEMGAVAAIVMSTTTFAGSAQIAAVSILATGGQPLAAILAAVLLNLRYGPIGVSVAPFVRGGAVRRFLVGQLVVDESWAVASRGDGRFDARTLIGAGIVLWAAWVMGTVIGVAGGEWLGDPTSLGLDAAFPALFLALVAPQLRSRRAMLTALAGAGIALALLPLSPSGVPIIAASAAALIGWWRG